MLHVRRDGCKEFYLWAFYSYFFWVFSIAERAVYRPIDFVARYGGEEFMILLPETSLDGALVLGEKIRDFLASMSWKENQKGTSLGKITLSFGISCLSEKDTTDSLIKRADDALYHSKQNGRNRVTPENMLAN